MSKRAASEAQGVGEWPEGPLVQGDPLEPIRYIERTLTRPDGEQVVVRVPVYPPFRLETWPPSASEARHLGVPRAALCEPQEAPEEVELELEEDAA